MPRRSLEAPVFFTSASRVKIPFVGDDTREVKIAKAPFYPISNPLERHHDRVSDYFVRLVSDDVKFDKDVILERSSHTLSFKDQDFTKLFSETSGAAKRIPKHARQYPGRFDTRGYMRKPPGHLKKLALPNSSAMPKKKITSRKQTSTTPDDQQQSPDMKDQKIPDSKPIFLTEAPSDSVSDKKPKRDMLQKIVGSDVQPSPDAREWDSHLLNQLSKDTAHWIVYESLVPGPQKAKLNRFLRDKYGDKISNTQLVHADISETDMKKLKKSEEEELKKEMDIKRIKAKERQRQSLRDDVQHSKTMAEYYKLPHFLRQQQSRVVRSRNEVNETAQLIKVKHLTQPPPPKMQDFLNSKAGDYINTTENEFEQRLYTGQAKPIHQKESIKSRVIMDDHSEYRVKIYPQFPGTLDQWVHDDDLDLKKATKSQRTVKGLQRWVQLPEPADFMSERGLNPPKSEEAQIEHVEYRKRDSMVGNLPMITLVEEWRSKWKLAGRWQEVPISEIIIDMDSLHDHVRLGSVAACAVASLHKKPINDLAAFAVLPGRQHSLPVNIDNKGHLPDALVEKVKEKLKDSNARVRLAAAICLYSLDLKDERVTEILKTNIKQGYSADRLAAAQCLALNGKVGAEVIFMLIQLLMEPDSSPVSDLSSSQKEQATMLLVHISGNSKLVHSLLAEQLNSGSWKERVTACQVLAKLIGNINRDVVHKLTNLMWKDWSSEVRKAAAQTLGRTGHGRDIHYELCTKLSQADEMVKVDVLKKIAHLHIMTAALLPPFMCCFTDSYVSVRLQACCTAGKLRLRDETVVKELARLMQYDPCWKIKAHAIKSIGEIGLASKVILDMLVWALRFEDEPGVRMEASKALRILHKDTKPDNDTLLILQDRALVEPDPLVKAEVKETLESFGVSSLGDNMEMILQIKNEVKRLCEKGVIAAKITMYEKELEKYQHKARYIGTGYEEYEESTDSLPGSLEESELKDELGDLDIKQRLSVSAESNVPGILVTPTSVTDLQSETDVPILDSKTPT